ncbi:DNA cytosine methyltransferase [Georgenia sp. SUBG003]|uniref:DNA cytosine methyltransferase n=1 Tax=Georgenia sp. SUBG003 TaxID=1497974 RepID=UPI0004D83E33|nr:DNA methyltransferase [Georgenia sp. SUBG003]
MPQVTDAPSSKTDEVRVLDLFAGAGGLTEGFRQASARFRSIGAVELDLSAAASYAANHGDSGLFVGPIETWLEQVDGVAADVIVGGPPCQGFSTLGKQDAEDERNGLWRSYAATIERVRPKYFVVENVARFLVSPQLAQFREAVSDDGRLRDYTFEARELNAADFGAGQARRRAVLIGHHRDLPSPGFPEPTTLRTEWQTVRDRIGDLADVAPHSALPERRTTFASRELPGTYLTSELHIARTYRPLSLERFAHIPYGGNRFDLPDHLLARCWRSHKSGSADVMGRLVWEKPSVTIRTEFFKPEKGRYLHPTAPRALTHLEAARLQGFPDDYRWVGSRTAIARQIGNAVPIALGKEIGRHILQRLDQHA